MIQGKWFPPGDDLTAAVSVRRAVLGFDTDSLDPESWNVLVFILKI